MTTDHKEIAFEDAIEAELLSTNEYAKGDRNDFDASVALDKKTLFDFIEKSQTDRYSRLIEIHGNDCNEKILNRLTKELDGRGMIDVLRHGIDTHGVHLDLAYFKPASRLNPDAEKAYNTNILKVYRQVHHSVRHPNQSLDLMIALNGLPILTAELKNALSGQNIRHAIEQYRNDRDVQDPIFEFKKRALVHFAIDTDLVEMTTRLNGKKTFFLPFNRGYKNGKGNPPPDNEGEYRTSYLWREVWSKDSLLDILKRFVHLQVSEEKDDNEKTVKKETLIFPRYHQLNCVRKAAEDARECGPGKNYLIQHSAGSGKSNSIAWLAYHLSDLHDNDDVPVFQSVVVVTDRSFSTDSCRIPSTSSIMLQE